MILQQLLTDFKKNKKNKKKFTFFELFCSETRLSIYRQEQT